MKTPQRKHTTDKAKTTSRPICYRNNNLNLSRIFQATSPVGDADRKTNILVADSTIVGAGQAGQVAMLELAQPCQVVHDNERDKPLRIQ